MQFSLIWFKKHYRRALLEGKENIGEIELGLEQFVRINLTRFDIHRNAFISNLRELLKIQIDLNPRGQRHFDF